MKMQKVFLKTKFTLLCLWTFVILSQVLKTKFYFIYYPLFFLFYQLLLFLFLKKEFLLKVIIFLEFKYGFFIFYFYTSIV